MKISKVAATTARRLFGLCHADGKLDEGRMRTVISSLANEKPRDYRAILAALHRLIRLEDNRRKVTVESAETLPQHDRDRVAANLTSQYGEGLDYDFKVNPELLGGLRIRVGDDVFDGSVQGRIERLAAAF